MMYAEAFRWVLEDRVLPLDVRVQISLSLSDLTATHLRRVESKTQLHTAPCQPFGPWLGPFSRLAQLAAPAARSEHLSLDA